MRVTLITDASRNMRGKASGYGYVIRSARGEIKGGGTIKQGNYTPNTEILEAMALVNALSIGRSSGMIKSLDRVDAYTDNIAAIRILTTRDITKNTKRQQRVIQAFRDVKRSMKVTIYHIKSDSTEDHRYCDMMAKKGAGVFLGGENE